MKKLLLIASAVSIAAASAAMAHTTHYGTSVTAEAETRPHIPGCYPGDSDFPVYCDYPAKQVISGQVSSSRAACKRDRLVKLFQTRSGARGTLVDITRTNRSGEYTMATGDFFWPGNGDDYYAKVPRQNIGPAAHRHICDSAESDRVRFPGE
jgi:hypothetical protein